MAGFDGAHVLVLVNMGTDATPNWQAVAAQTGFSTDASRNMLDGSVKGTDHAQSAYGRMESSASMEGLVSFGDGTQQRLEDAMKNREEIVLRYEVGVAALPEGAASSDVYEAPALVSKISRSYPDNENSSFSAEFNLNAAWAKAA
jgi:TP901-1 family phage major tail protein